jgi:hypothetical protein
MDRLKERRQANRQSEGEAERDARLDRPLPRRRLRQQDLRRHHPEMPLLGARHGARQKRDEAAVERGHRMERRTEVVGVQALRDLDQDDRPGCTRRLSPFTASVRP